MEWSMLMGRAGVHYAAGTICWGSTTHLSVEKYLEEVEEKKKDKEAGNVRVPSTNASAGRKFNLLAHLTGLIW